MSRPTIMSLYNYGCSYKILGFIFAIIVLIVINPFLIPNWVSFSRSLKSSINPVLILCNFALRHFMSFLHICKMTKPQKRKHDFWSKIIPIFDQIWMFPQLILPDLFLQVLLFSNSALLGTIKIKGPVRKDQAINRSFGGWILGWDISAHAYQQNKQGFDKLWTQQDASNRLAHVATPIAQPRNTCFPLP